MTITVLVAVSFISGLGYMILKMYDSILLIPYLGTSLVELTAFTETPTLTNLSDMPMQHVNKIKRAWWLTSKTALASNSLRAIPDFGIKFGPYVNGSVAVGVTCAMMHYQILLTKCL